MFSRKFICAVLLACGLASVHAQTTVVSTVVGSDSHETLEALLTRAELTGTLASDTRSFTVFAPTDAAFGLVPDGTLKSKITADPIDAKWKPLLQDVLMYHVLSNDAAVLAAALPDPAQDYDTLSAGSVLTIGSTAPQINAKAPGTGAATVDGADLQSDNGVVHSVNAVLFPPSTLRNVVDIVVGSNAHTTLESLMTPELIATLQTDNVDTAFTIFAPTDAAFAKLDTATVTCLQADANKDLLVQLLSYHVVSGTTTSGMLPAAGGSVPSIATGFSSNAIARDDIMPTTGSVDLLATNGVVHSVDDVLIPPNFACPGSTIVDVVIGSDDHSTLEALVVASGLAPTLQGTGKFTLLAPTNAAVAALPQALQTKLAGVDSDNTDWLPLLQEVLKFHVLDGNTKVMAADLPGTATDLDTLADGAMITASSTAPQFKAKSPGTGEASAVATDLYAFNGVVHSIDAVLLPPVATRTVVDIATGSTAHTTLVSLLQSAELVDTLSANSATSAFTVFAPTNTAFEAVDAATLTCLQAEENKDLLIQLLSYHVASGVVHANDLGDSVASIATDFTSNSIPSANIDASATDLLATNGVVHVVDAVLIPEGFTCTVIEADDSSASSTSVSALLATGLVALVAAMQARF